MLIRLLKMWHRKEPASLVDVTPGVADYLIRAGIGEAYENTSRTDERSYVRTTFPVRSEEASRDSGKRHNARHSTRSGDSRSA